MGRTCADRRRGWALAATFLLLAASSALASPGVAHADLRFHGSSAMAEETCAGCHRPYTAVGTLSWSSAAGETRGLLPAAKTVTLSNFCLSCHGRAGAGAATNVYDGVYESDEHGRRGAGLNGGAFGYHLVRGDHHPYGGCDSPECASRDRVVITCGTCHDFHGSSNYRLLADVVNGVRVGGYVLKADETAPDPFVISNEPGYPTGGWARGAEREAQMAVYDPDYSTPMYAKAPADDPARGMSGWCSACHDRHRAAGQSSASDAGGASTSIADGPGDVGGSGHPVNTPLGAYRGPRPIRLAGLTLPVAHDPGSRTPGATAGDWIDCLTCHRAHGSAAAQTDWSGVTASAGASPPGAADEERSEAGNALLRLGGVGVCEACHAM